MNPFLFLGVGEIALAVRRAQPAAGAFGTTRGVPDARFASITPLGATATEAIRSAAQGASVVVSFPPDGRSDAEFAALIAGAASIVYLSSTAVYPPDAGVVTELSPVFAASERARLRLAAEATWRGVGASVVRLPAFYGAACGLHLSIARGSFRMPGTGANVVSRVHVDDAARFVLAALAAPAGSVLLAGDAEPAPVAAVVHFVCELFGLSPPSASEGPDVPLSLRGSRSIDTSATRARFGVQLAYPSYRDGYRAIHASK